MLVTSKYRIMVFFLFFLALKYAWKAEGQKTNGLKDSDLIAQTKKKPKKKEETKEECKTMTKYTA